MIQKEKRERLREREQEREKEGKKEKDRYRERKRAQMSQQDRWSVGLAGSVKMSPVGFGFHVGSCTPDMRTLFRH